VHFTFEGVIFQIFYLTVFVCLDNSYSFSEFSSLRYITIDYFICAFHRWFQKESTRRSQHPVLLRIGIYSYYTTLCMSQHSGKLYVAVVIESSSLSSYVLADILSVESSSRRLPNSTLIKTSEDAVTSCFR